MTQNMTSRPSMVHQLAASHRDLFNAIDSLSEAGLPRKVIPRVVVLGDQKSGKSSVLHAISQIPFPVEDGLCTKFPIEVVQRRADKASIVVTISVLGPRPNHNELRNFHREISVEDATSLSNAIDEASRLILATSRFSDDILRISITGPDKYPLTLIDLPGLFTSVTKQQTKEDRDQVDRMVRRYLEEPRNAFLLVISARSTWPTLKAPDEISQDDADPGGLRTFGIITNPDQVYSQSEILRHFKGQGPLNLKAGWHCLRNSTEKERKLNSDRNEIEEIYFRDNWDEILEECKGIQSLQPRLLSFVTSQLRRHLADLIRDVRSEMDALNKLLSAIQSNRGTEQSQRNYLSRMAADFQSIASSAVDGHYGGGTMAEHLQDFFNNPKDSTRDSQPKRLQAVIRAMSQLFHSTMISEARTTTLLEERQANLSSGLSNGLFETGSMSDPDEDVVSNSNIKTSFERGKDTQRQDEDEEVIGDGEDEEQNDDVQGDLHARAQTNEAFEEKPHDKQGTSNASRSLDCGKMEAFSNASTILSSEVLAAYKALPSTTQRRSRTLEDRAKEMTLRYRGVESLNEVNQAMISHLFREETTSWRAISQRHLSLVWNAVSEFVKLALDHCVERSISRDIRLRIINNRLLQLRRGAEQKLEEILSCHEGMNPAFYDLLGELDDNFFNLRRNETSRDPSVYQNMFTRIQNTVTTETIGIVLDSVSPGTDWGIPLKSHAAKILLKKLEENFKTVILAENEGYKADEWTYKEMENTAVHRAISILGRYYKVW